MKDKGSQETPPLHPNSPFKLMAHDSDHDVNDCNEECVQDGIRGYNQMCVTHFFCLIAAIMEPLNDFMTRCVCLQSVR